MFVEGLLAIAARLGKSQFVLAIARRMRYDAIEGCARVEGLCGKNVVDNLVVMMGFRGPSLCGASLSS